MNINVNQIPQEGLVLEELIDPASLDLDTPIIKFRGPVSVKAKVDRITNAVTALVAVKAMMQTACSRCLVDLDIGFSKDFRLSYPVDQSVVTLELNPDIREEIILDYPVKPLCKPDCKGLCPDCGENLNEGKCKCK